MQILLSKNCVVIAQAPNVFSLTEAPLPDPTLTPPNTPKRTRTEPKQTETAKSSSLGCDGRGFCRVGGGGGVVREKENHYTSGKTDPVNHSSLLCDQERKISPKRKLWGRISHRHPGVIRADIPPQNFGQGPQIQEKASIRARTSMTRKRAEYGFGEYGFKHRTQ